MIQYLCWARGHVPLEVNADDERSAASQYARRYRVAHDRPIGVVPMDSLHFYGAVDQVALDTMADDGGPVHE